ncbi:hypothetical protein PR202_ga11231 [Eleusine coracana subsp. coracana]|uniref:Serine/threonine specific protein phosphatases domain-containing protein n=1 Tax=Eleusine coracana subsp. coracana TaxID=191504 RepID=A0AAV5C8K2_ELECO|nr:hypothetical protein PR202_ga11231 [Eleusine coracana subsp. coracana]
MHPSNNDQSYPARKALNRQRSPQGLHKKIEYPENVHLIREIMKAADINALFGFRIECIERMGESDGIWAWTRFNQLFNYLPLAAMIEKKIICMHGGIGRSDPTENDSVEGLRPNARGPGLVTFGPDRVTEFYRSCTRYREQCWGHTCGWQGISYRAKVNSSTSPPPVNSPESSPERGDANMDAGTDYGLGILIVCRNLTFSGHLLQPEGGHMLPVIGILLLTYE